MDQYLIESFREKHREFEEDFKTVDNKIGKLNERLDVLEKDSILKGYQIDEITKVIGSLKEEFKSDIMRIDNSVMKEARETRDVFREEREWLRQQLNTQKEAEEAASTREHNERMDERKTKRTFWQFFFDTLKQMFIFFGALVAGMVAYQEIFVKLIDWAFK